jgi:RNA recognition motif-containing protein
MLVITRGYLFPSLDQGRLFVKNLPYDASEDDIAKLFAKCGKVAMDPWCVSAALQYL